IDSFVLRNPPLRQAPNRYRQPYWTTVQTLTNRHKRKIANAQMAHLVFADTQANASKNQKSHFLPTHRLTTTEV
ncbi:MAG: hypothetical protein LC109_03500, partial [Bacteroidia bacterium]|nr:hypothetical protein [Bacteroidia bacterium]